MNTLNDQIEPQLCFARESARKGDWTNTHKSVRAARDYLELHRKPQAKEFDVVSVLRRAVSAATWPPKVTAPGGTTIIGDEEQMSVVLRSLIDSARLEFDATLECVLLDVDGVPTIRFRLDGPGQFPVFVTLGNILRLPREFIDTAWTNATRGGRIDTQVSQLDLRLKGVRMCTDPPGVDEDFLDCVRSAERQARILASGEAGHLTSDAKDQILLSVSNALKSLDSRDDPVQPGDLFKLVHSVLSEHDSSDPVTIKVSAEGEVPPIVIRRNRVLRMIHSLRDMATHVLSNGGEMDLNLELDPKARAANLWVNLAGKLDEGPVDWFMPSIQRCVVETHGGNVELDTGSDSLTLLLSLPDCVARSLDEWLPGWDTFAPRSIQMLRLLKSGGPVPPEELILAGVLEDELERRLLPRLSIAPATNLAHELTPNTIGLPGASAARMEKSINQIRRGKPKKEICSAASAAEILYIYSIDDRHRSAVGARVGEHYAMKTLSRMLLSTNLNYLESLKLVAKVLSPP